MVKGRGGTIVSQIHKVWYTSAFARGSICPINIWTLSQSCPCPVDVSCGTVTHINCEVTVHRKRELVEKDNVYSTKLLGDSQRQKHKLN